MIAAILTICKLNSEFLPTTPKIKRHVYTYTDTVIYVYTYIHTDIPYNWLSYFSLHLHVVTLFACISIALRTQHQDFDSSASCRHRHYQVLSTDPYD